MKLLSICLSTCLLQTFAVGWVIGDRNGILVRDITQTASVVSSTSLSSEASNVPTSSAAVNTISTATTTTQSSSTSSTTTLDASNSPIATSDVKYAKPYIVKPGYSTTSPSIVAGEPFSIYWATTDDSDDVNAFSTCYEFVISLLNNTNSNRIGQHDAYAFPNNLPHHSMTIANLPTDQSDHFDIPASDFVAGNWSVRLEFHCANESVTPHVQDYTLPIFAKVDTPSNTTASNSTISVSTPNNGTINNSNNTIINDNQTSASEHPGQFWTVIIGCVIGACLIFGVTLALAIRSYRNKKSKVNINENTIYELHAANALHELSPVCKRMDSPIIHVWETGSRVDSFGSVRTVTEPELARGKIFFELEGSEPPTPSVNRMRTGLSDGSGYDGFSEPPTPNMLRHVRDLDDTEDEESRRR